MTKIVRKKAKLLPIFDEINEQYFGGLVCAGIGWRNLSLKPGDTFLGLCESSERLIKINYLLDDEDVPEWYLKYVVYHEMLHLVYPPSLAEEEGHTDTHHNPRFTALERRYPQYKQCQEFDQTELPAILDKWRTRKRTK